MEPAPSAGDPFGVCGTQLAGRFFVEAPVAEGGFGVVYRGTQLVLDRPVAIKILKTPPQFNDDQRATFRARFAEEGKLIARLKHANIVDVYDFGILASAGGDVPWMALEWLDGQTLEADLTRRREGRGEGMNGRSPVEVMTLMRPILAALAFAHRQGIAHRDIKPANIMVLRGDASLGPTLKVLDFGISKIVHADEVAGGSRTSSMPAFSPAYAAPEQVTFSRTGLWTDVHALGLVLCELLTDRAPFDQQGLAVFEQVMQERRPTPGLFGRDVGAWEPILQKAVALSPGQRWRNAGELLQALEGGLEAAQPRTAVAATAAITARPGATRVLADAGRVMPAPASPPRAGQGTTGRVRADAAGASMKSSSSSSSSARRWPVLIAVAIVALVSVFGIGRLLWSGAPGPPAAPETPAPLPPPAAARPAAVPVVAPDIVAPVAPSSTTATPVSAPHPHRPGGHAPHPKPKKAGEPMPIEIE